MTLLHTKIVCLSATSGMVRILIRNIFTIKIGNFYFVFLLKLLFDRQSCWTMLSRLLGRRRYWERK
ncbi:hypothetical protein BST81_02025 [Leptolyngbya sp. 'hensonii']|nr:hypothetical protein BST81_02025 [Leptolyngbya sp. 'hensonii']